MHKKIGSQSALKRAFESVKDYREIQPDEFTCADFVRFCADGGVKIKTKTANERLKAMVDSGELESRETIVKSVRMNVYREKS